MKYIIVDGRGNIMISQDSKEVDIFLTKGEGVFHIINIYGNYVYVEKYQVENGKIYRVDSVKL